MIPSILKFFTFKKIHFSIRLSLFFSFIFLIILFCYRFVLLFFNKNKVETESFSEIGKAFLVGFRFDLSTVSILTVLILILTLPINFKKFIRIRKFFIVVPFIFLIYLTVYLSIDILYFENSNKHLGYEGIVFMGKDFWVILRSGIKSDFLFILSSFLCLIFVILLVKKVSDKIFSSKENLDHTEIAISISHNVIIIALCIIFARGGFQPSPISPGNAVYSKNYFLNHLALNGIFTSISELRWKHSPHIQNMRIEESALIVREEIDYEGSEFVSIKYPILRKSVKKNIKPPNIFLIILESWTAKFIGDHPLYHKKTITPNFNKLIKEGIYFKNFFSTGGRTSNGLFAILTGIPDRPGFSVIHSQNALKNVSGIGNILKSAGYETSFFYGGELEFENIKPLVSRWGFDALYDMDEIALESDYIKGVWGYNDKDLFDFLHKKLNSRNTDKPFFVSLLTVSTHYPYKVPEKKFELFNTKEQESNFLNTLHYADFAIGDFIQKAEKSEYFKNSVFLFVADHTHHKNLNYFEDRNIPFLVYSKNLKREIRDDFASQLDIIPTIIGIAGIETYFSAMGKDLFSKNKKNSAYFAYGNIFGWIEGDTFFLDAVDKSNALHFSSRPPLIEKELCNKNPLPCIIPQKKARAYLNLSEDLLEKNMVFPEFSSLKKGDFL